MRFRWTLILVTIAVASLAPISVNGNTVYAIPHDRLRQVLEKYNRLVE